MAVKLLNSTERGGKTGNSGDTTSMQAGIIVIHICASNEIFKRTYCGKKSRRKTL